MPIGAGTLYNTIRKPQGGIYDANDIARVEIEDDRVKVEVVLTDPAQSVNTVGNQVTPPATTNQVNTSVVTSTSGSVSCELPGSPPPELPAWYQDPEIMGRLNKLLYQRVSEWLAIHNQTPIREQITTGSATSALPRGTLFHDPLCDTCCHSPTDSPSQYYNLCLLVSTDPNITTMIENGLLEQVYGSIPVLEEKYRRGDPGATLKEANFLDFTNQQQVSLFSSDFFRDVTAPGSYTIKQEMELYQFKQTYDFIIPKDCSHLAIFTYVTLDPVAYEQYLRDSSTTPFLVDDQIPRPTVYNGTIKELVVIKNSYVQAQTSMFFDPNSNQRINTAVRRTRSGEYETFDPTSRRQSRKVVKLDLPIGNIRSSKIFNKIIKDCSLSLVQAIQRQNNTENTSIQNKFWLSRMPNNNILFMMYDHEQLVMQNCFIKNLKSKEVYDQQEFQAVEVEKIDLLDETNTRTINRTYGIRTTRNSIIKDNIFVNAKVEPDQETISSNGGPVVLSKIKEIPNFGKRSKFIQLLDYSTTSGKFAYKFTFRFKDPTIVMLKKLTEEFITRVDNVSAVYSRLEQNRTEFKKTSRKFSNLINNILDAAKSAISKANQILNMLPNSEYNPTLFTNYMSCLANPKTSTKDHDNFILILRTLEGTLVDLLSSAGVRVKNVGETGTTGTNSRASTAKQKTFVSVELQSQELEIGNGIGVDFMSFTDLEGKETPVNGVYDIDYLRNRGQQEFNKFWDSREAASLNLDETALKEKATFYLTPNRLYGLDEQIDLSTIPAFDFLFETKLKKLKLSKNKKSIKSSNISTLLESVDNLPASFQIVDSEFDFTDISIEQRTSKSISFNYLENQTNFTQNNIDTSKNRARQADRNNTFNDKILSSIESAFSEGFDSLTDSNTINDIKSNTSLEQVVDSTDITSLPPSLQAYKLRDSSASRMSTFVNDNGLLTEPSNQIYLKNYFGLVYKIQYASISSRNLNGLEWVDLNSNNLSNAKNLFCRIVPVSNLALRLEQELGELDVYNEYFVIQNTSTSRQSRNSIEVLRPITMLETRNTSRSEASIGKRIQSIMNQKTTYDSGSPIAYTSIIY